MPTLIDLRRRIQSVRNSQQITQAMKTVSTAKFRKAQRTVQEARPFWHIFPELMGRLAYWAASGTHPLLLRRTEKKIAVIVVTADKGLAGAYNSNLLEAADAFLAKKSATATIRLVLMGKKAVVHLRKGPYPVDRAFGDRTDRLTREELRDLAEELMRAYTFQAIDALYIVTNEFKSILAPRIMTHRVLPIERDAGQEESATWRPDWDPEAARLAAF
ncbi:MAG: F0F1 ATP synthase subunit gamma, partial [Candidatus Aminicenantes bacterium]|nr:F0F1 ATP synthase subunit gamma [Candidatus Aminicenantes bacterium]